MKLTNIPRKLWEHKKKSALAVAIAYGTGFKAWQWKRDCDIRAIYAREAKRFGDVPLALTGRLRRVTVLVDTTCPGAFDNFKKNALPLFNLAGLQVEIIKPTDVSEFKTIAEHIDTTECDALYIIGGDSTLSTVLSAVYHQRNNSPVPIGVFPGGSENRSLVGLVPGVFTLQNDIRPHCESAMALIEEKIQPVYLTSVRLENSESSMNNEKQQLYGISGLHVGWYDRAETNKNKLWYLGQLKRWIAYITATLRSFKQYPEVDLNIVSEEYCAGCSKCRSQSSFGKIKEQRNKRWWHYIVGSANHTAVDGLKPEMDYSSIKNEKCGKTREVKIKSVDVALENIQDQSACGIRVRTGGAGRSRISLLLDGWTRCQTKQLSTSPDAAFYQNDLFLKSAILKFNLLPKPFRKITIFGSDYKIDDDLKTRIFVESTNKYVNMYLPSKIRVL
uniref:DAGKc domain-containing protein n=1 Tax=Setaria digitata TaxID=48799 RepID=A0A915Q382_9BILA